jgi:hypothetical protein
MNRPLAMVLTLVLVACASAASPSTATPVAICEEAPPDELEVESEVGIIVSPNPAKARETASLTVSPGDLPSDSVVGVDAEWQCWDGSTWATTHIVYRGFGDNAGQTIPVNSNFQIQVPSIGLALDQDYPIVIPQVTPGTYRIRDEVLASGERVSGFAFVEVVAG